MVGHLGVHRADHGDVVDVLGRLGKQLADLDPALAVRRNLNGDGKAAPVLRSVRRVSGSVLPASFASAGLGSKVSTCDGPPFRKKWMTRRPCRGNAVAVVAGWPECQGARRTVRLRRPGRSAPRATRVPFRIAQEFPSRARRLVHVRITCHGMSSRRGSAISRCRRTRSPSAAPGPVRPKGRAEAAAPPESRPVRPRWSSPEGRSG